MNIFTYSVKYRTNLNLSVSHFMRIEATDQNNAAGKIRRYLMQQPGVTRVIIKSITKISI